MYENIGIASWTVPPEVPHWIGNNTMDFTYLASMSSIVITASASNSCGQTNFNFIFTKKTSGCTSSYAMVAYPNPTQDVLNIEMMSVSQGFSNEEAPFIDSAILLDGNGEEVVRGMRNGAKIMFDVSRLKKGVYFIHVVVDGELTREQIIID